MKNSKRKHFLLMLLIILIAVFSVKYMMIKANMEKKSSVAVILPKEQNGDESRIMDGIRDYAGNHGVLLDVWYKEKLSFHELEMLIEEEEKNHVTGILLVYPEKYMYGEPDENNDFEHVLAITETMKGCFLYTATFEENGEQAYALPVPSEVIEQLSEDSSQFIYIKNTYKLGYCSMKQMEQMDNIRLEYRKADGKTIAGGEIDSLLTE